MKIHGYNKTTLLDFPGKVACTVFTGSCNFRCPFCHNGDLVLDPSSQPLVPCEEFFAFLDKRKFTLEGVCITGGEPTLNSDLPEFIAQIREHGLEVKLDTNGTRPDIIASLIEKGIISYIAMDVKSSPSGYGEAVGIPDYNIDKIKESVLLLKEGKVPYEFRTTVVKELHNEEVFRGIAEWIQGCKAYYLQAFKDSKRLLYEMEPQIGRYPDGLHGYSPSEMKAFAEKLKEWGIPTEVRGVD